MPPLGRTVRNRKRCRPGCAAKAILLLLAPLAASLVRAASSKSSSCSSLAHRSCVPSLRGGEDSSKEQTSQRFRSSQSLHRFNQDIMAAAQSFDESETVVQEKSRSEKKKKRGRHVKQKEKIDRAQNGRGGALTAVKKTPPNRDSKKGIFSWLAPPTTSAEGKEQTKQKDLNKFSKQDENLERNDANTTATTGGPDLAKLWFVNVWAQQLPDRLDNTTTKNNLAAVPPLSTTEMDRGQSRKPRNNNNSAVRKSKGSFPASKDDSRINRAQNYESVAKLKKGGTVLQEELVDSKANKSVNVTSVVAEDKEAIQSRVYVSAGAWAAIDGLTSLGLSRIHPAFRISRPLRPIRKITARVTGLHGALSGKPRNARQMEVTLQEKELGEEDLAMVRRRIAAIDKARVGVEKIEDKSDESARAKKKGRWWGKTQPETIPEVKQIATVAAEMTIPSIRKSPEELEEEQRRKERVQEIDRLMGEAQKQLQQLACEKDELQRRPNPLWVYSTEKVSKKRGNQTAVTTRQFNFPPDDLVSEYLDFLLSSGRLVKMNHTDLWQNDVLEEDEDESIGDELGPSSPSDDKRNRNNGNHGGFWILRQSLGKGSTLGEKIGEATEQAAYTSIAKAVMGALARSISAIHGANIMTHTDIRLSMEATPDLPPMSKQGIIPGGRNPNYARDALQGAMRRGAKRNREKRYRYDLSEDAFVQRDAVVETLISHVQIAAPLLKLFPLAWQRAMLANIITLVTAVVADFCEGVQFEILGHRLSFSFKPITESDMINHIAMAGPSFNRQNLRSEQFEAAVQATANDVSENLKFLDRWHERLLGSGVLRSQIANLIARLVLTLAGEVLSGAQMDLWAAQAGGPRMVAGLEFRTTANYMEEMTVS